MEVERNQENDMEKWKMKLEDVKEELKKSCTFNTNIFRVKQYNYFTVLSIS